jgi:hypothetical protein
MPEAPLTEEPGNSHDVDRPEWTGVLAGLTKGLTDVGSLDRESAYHPSLQSSLFRLQ